MLECYQQLLFLLALQCHRVAYQVQGCLQGYRSLLKACLDHQVFLLL